MQQQRQRTKKIQYHAEGLTKHGTAPEIETYKLSVQAAMEIYELSKSFPEEERYSLTRGAIRT